ncbi:hypothetical protein ACED66_15395 [Vibrio splendidus]|uniref:hypothetical protein n=1 Tax=Vibrio splendidus TaxID=29497 RepID=UPI000D38996D|nr:hypothetical protein [Vibrio splendidus]PTO99630.1 hypothetical protein CWN88_17070 [Vibrio splendidus]PTP94136.1 hypothetical protein CWO28_23975 [Vibrio splendidus]
MNWLINNKEWIFSGVGVSAILFFISLFKKNSNLKQVQKSGSNSNNYQAGGDIQVGMKNDK